MAAPDDPTAINPTVSIPRVIIPTMMIPTVIIIGGDALALSTAREISQVGGHRVVVLWPADLEFAVAVEAAGAVFVAGRPDSSDGLEAAGVRHAVSILALSRDDQLNLHGALQARDANPRIRIVLRQFNRTLAAKIEQNLPDCSVLSLAWHSAATYAAVALDPFCFRGLQFPERDGPLTGFASRIADREDLAGHTVGEAEAALGARIVAIDAAAARPRQPAGHERSGTPHAAPLPSAGAPDGPVHRPICGGGTPIVRRHNVAFPRRFQYRLADRGLFRDVDDDDDRVWRHHPQSHRNDRHRHGDGADAVGDGVYRNFHRVPRVAADPSAMGADAGPAPDPPARSHRRLRLRQHRDRGHRPPA